MNNSMISRNLIHTTKKQQSGPPRVIGKKEVDSKKAYFERWFSLLTKENEAQTKLFQSYLSNQNTAELIKEGSALFGLKAESKGWLFDSFMVRFFLPGQQQLPFHRLTQGDVILISKTHPTKDLVLQGTILDRTRNSITITTQDTLPSELSSNLWRMDRGADAITFQKCLDALRSATNQYSTSTSKSTTITTTTRRKPIGLSIDLMPFFFGHDLSKEVLTKLASKPPNEKLSSIYRGKSLPSDFDVWKLNESQKRVVLEAPKRTLLAVRGPPGTGKTQTAIYILLYLVHLLKGSNITILATSFTNIGCDNLLEGLLEKGVNALRVGNPTRVKENLRIATVDYKLSHHRLVPTLERLRAERGLPEVINNVQTTILREVIYGAQVICSTCIGSLIGFMEDLEFPIVLIDECTQATEPALLCPLVKGCKQLIILGDDFQLGPTIVSQEQDIISALGLSFFQRMVEQGGIEPFLLEIQYRMHPLISEWPSKHFYSSKLQNGITPNDRPLPLGFNWPGNQPVAFIPVVGSNFERDSCGSKFNDIEITVLCEVIKGLMKEGNNNKPGSIGIITPYLAQMRNIIDKIHQDCKFQVGQFSEFNDNATPEEIAAQEAETITVQTVDGYQGREKDIIIFSAVRSNKQKSVGFLSDWRRMNVAITRAKRGLIIIGDPETLQNDPHWKDWINWANEKHLVCQPPTIIPTTPSSTIPREKRSSCHDRENEPQKQKFKH